MAHFIVRNSLNPNKVVKFNITLQQQVLNTGEGEPIWTAEINTLETTVSGVSIGPKYIHLRSLENLDEEVNKAVSELSEQVDWSPRQDDSRGPYVSSYLPTGSSSVNIDSKIQLVIKESLPSSGIDINSLSVELDGIDITNEVEVSGDPYEYNLKWKPRTVIYESFD